MEIFFRLCDTLCMSREPVGVVIRRHRLAAGMTQKELAAEIEMTDRTVSSWETGKMIPSREALLKLAKIFQIGLDDFNLTEEESAQIDVIVEDTPSPDLAAILEEINAEGRFRPDIARALRDWLAGWRARGDGDLSH
jgi:transcriptional regulator with XRE-family HTH domain